MQKLVIVAKKEHNNMRRLIELFASTHPELRGKRVLIVDDEADFASVRFAKKKGSDTIDQGRIASQIDELRRELARCAFLQVTATPYALYLQPDEYETPSGANMTFEPKRPAFTKLVPIHSAYVGGDHYFGDHEEDRAEYFLWHEVERTELDALKKEDRRRFGIEDVLTTDKVQALRAALANFVTAGAIRRLQQRAAGQRPRHYAMIVHVETSRLAHDWQHRVTQAVLDKMKAAIVGRDAIADRLIDAPKEGEPLPFDHARAHRLYTALFGEVADLIKGKHLLIVPSGPLTQLPFEVLATRPPVSGDHRAAAWLAREHATTVLPAVSSLKALRRVGRSSTAPRPMIGIGNPLLDGPDGRYVGLAKQAQAKQR